ncbi:MAG: extracellular solute-binding protein [Treponema sp.]|nr:extracellular solute-binding protein [Treponema sp.]
MRAKVKAVSALLLLLCMTGMVFASGGQAQTQAPAGPVSIELWYGLSMTESPPPPADWNVLQLIKDKLNIDLKISALPSSDNDQATRIQAAAAANALPDLFQIGRGPWLNLVKTGLLGAVDDLYPLMPVRTKDMHNADARAFTTYNGKNYGFAAVSTIEKNEGIVIRKDWLTKLGLSVPVTTEDLFNVMKAFTNNDPDGNGRADTYGYGAFIENTVPYEYGLGRRLDPIMGAFGVAGAWNFDSKKAGLVVRDPAFFDALTYVKRMVDEKVIDPNWLSYTKDDFRAAWKQGRFGIMREQFAALCSQSNYAPFDQNFPNGEWMVIDPPKGPSGQSAVGVFPTPYRVYSVSTKAIQAGKGPSVAKLLEWMSTDGYYLLGWGQQGVNFVLGPDGAPTSAGIPDPSKGWDKPDVVSITQLRNMVFYNSDIELIARYPSFKTAAGRTMNMLDVLAQMQGKAWTPNNGSTLMPAASADLERFYNQGVVEFVTGQRPLTQANWTAWVADFDKVGGLAWQTDGINKARDENYLY